MIRGLIVRTALALGLIALGPPVLAQVAVDPSAQGMAVGAMAAAQTTTGKPAGIKVAAYGHSFSAYGFSSSASSSIINDRSSGGWAAVLSNQRLTIDPAYNFGVAGETIAQILARIGSVTASDAAVVELWAGANDIWPYPQTVATMQAGYTSILDRLTAAGKIVICFPIVPRLPNVYTSAGATTPQILDAQQRAEQFNRWLVEDVAKRRNVFVVDVLDLWTDLSITSALQPPGGTSANSSSYTADGLHPSGLGAFILGLREADTFMRIAPTKPRMWQPYALFSTSANPNGNMALNPLFIGTGSGFAGTGVTGTLANNWAAQRYAGASVTAVASVVAKTLANGLTTKQQQLVITNGGATAQSIMLYQQVLASGNYTPGTTALRGSIDVEVDAGSQINGFRAGVLELNGGSVIFSAQSPQLSDTSATAPVLPTTAWTGRFRSPLFTTHVTGDRVWLQAEIFVPPGGSATVRFGNAELRAE